MARKIVGKIIGGSMILAGIYQEMAKVNSQRE
jgi:hypothetical protein